MLRGIKNYIDAFDLRVEFCVNFWKDRVLVNCFFSGLYIIS